ncbi:MAG: hypothetical protein F4139_07690 [Gemmatimonadetes bacterium]|nr:hypothetical protein [Gemmatimonadota bacterium]MYA63138.1 hypothetical protein [Gemmatimonadota bacterium]MYB98834.1 hypothetical protein [Gemmatimonadota bacterium]MYH52818.1 hypothetical protein [Gemmatimonadota bacterium]MYI46812.1 hypothetical protein [Gemmatimonadota bacterium]
MLSDGGRHHAVTVDRSEAGFVREEARRAGIAAHGRYYPDRVRVGYWTETGEDAERLRSLALRRGIRQR